MLFDISLPKAEGEQQDTGKTASNVSLYGAAK